MDSKGGFDNFRDFGAFKSEKQPASSVYCHFESVTFSRYNPRMVSGLHHESIDYLAIGHITRDISPQGARLGGSASYAALTAKAFGLRAGILTAWAEDLPLDALEDIPIVNIGAEQSTTFENHYGKEGRRQRIRHLAPPLFYHSLPEAWRSAGIVHLAPVLGEVSPRIASHFKEATLGITPQGWLREWGVDGSVILSDWPEENFVLGQCSAAVISLEDVHADEKRIKLMAASSAILAVTAATDGATIFAQGEVHSLLAPHYEQIDPTGAGDIFAAAFFIRLHFGDDPLEAGRVANQVAAQSVEREGLDGVPSPDEIYDLIREAL